MQKLTVSVKGKNGPETVKIVNVLRSWHSSSGAALYLFHGTGVYGYADGSPVKDESDLDLIDNPIHRAVAKKWWDARGRVMAESFYAARDAEEARMAGDFQDDAAPSDTALDAVMYQSRSKGKGKAEAWSGPFSWVERFSARPDWWGQARSIAFQDLEYRMLEEDAEQSPDHGVLPEAGVLPYAPTAARAAKVKAGEI